MDLAVNLANQEKAKGIIESIHESGVKWIEEAERVFREAIFELEKEAVELEKEEGGSLAVAENPYFDHLLFLGEHLDSLASLEDLSVNSLEQLIWKENITPKQFNYLKRLGCTTFKYVSYDESLKKVNYVGMLPYGIFYCVSKEDLGFLTVINNNIIRIKYCLQSKFRRFESNIWSKSGSSIYCLSSENGNVVAYDFDCELEFRE